MNFFRITLAMALAIVTTSARGETPGKAWVFFGTYTGKDSKGIYRSEIDLNNGALSEPQLAAEVASPSFLAIHPTNKFLYAVGEIDKFAGKNGGAVYSFSLDPATGSLKPLIRHHGRVLDPAPVGSPSGDSRGRPKITAGQAGGDRVPQCPPIR